MNLTTFFDSVRSSLFKGKLTAKQVKGMEFILEQWGETGFTDDLWLAFSLATAFHETAFTMQPIKERGGKAYFTKMYDIKGSRPAKARELGNTVPGDGAKYAGRGYVQLTGKTNYERASRALGIDFVSNPDLVMDPANAAFIMFQGMADGWFTGKKFSDYLNGVERDFRNARRIINGTDKAATIAGYARKFETAINASKPAVIPEFTNYDLREVQQKLKDLGYHEVGNVDGYRGRKTEAAIMAFRNENGMEITTAIDSALIKALQVAPKRTIGPERAAGKPKGSRILNSARVIKAGTAVGAAGTALTEVQGHIEKAEQAQGAVERGLSLFGIMDYIAPYWPFIAAAVAVVVIVAAFKVSSARVDDYRTGKTS